MNTMVRIWKEQRPGGYGKVKWLTYFRIVPEVLASPYAEGGKIIRMGQLLISYLNARLMECVLERWAESVQWTRDRLMCEAAHWEMKRNLEMRKIVHKIRSALEARVDSFRRQIEVGDVVRLLPWKQLNLQRALLISKYSTYTQGALDPIYVHETRRFDDELLVKEKRGSGLGAQILVRWFQFEWWIDVTDVDPPGEKPTPEGPWYHMPMTEELADTGKFPFGDKKRN